MVNPRIIADKNVLITKTTNRLIAMESLLIPRHDSVIALSIAILYDNLSIFWGKNMESRTL